MKSTLIHVSKISVRENPDRNKESDVAESAAPPRMRNTRPSACHRFDLGTFLARGVSDGLPAVVGEASSNPSEVGDVDLG